MGYIKMSMYSVEDIFSCTRCGYCCHGETTVSLDAEDQRRMIDALSEPRDVVEKKYWRITAGVVQMRVVDGHCIFYDKGCTVHEGRPWRCGQWPLHPSILIDENNFTSIAESCPGIKTDMGYQQFCRILKSLMEERPVSC